jgi:hypothetical protein
VHQQGGCEWPVRRCDSIAQRLSAPHSGQAVAGMTGEGVAAVDMGRV